MRNSGHPLAAVRAPSEDTRRPQHCRRVRFARQAGGWDGQFNADPVLRFNRSPVDGIGKQLVIALHDDPIRRGERLVNFPLGGRMGGPHLA